MGQTQVRRFGHATMTAAMSAAVSTMLLAGCKAPTYTDYSAFLQEPRPLVTSAEYRMAPPDVIQIKSKRVREMDGYSQQIRSDGNVTVPLIGNVFVAGRTPEDVSAELEALAREFYQDADVTLRVVEYRSKSIFVFGETSIVGPIPYNGANTVFGTLALVQPTRLADPSRIQVLRPNPDGQLVRRMTVDLNDMVEKGDTSLDAVLEEGDVIYVPPNPLARTGLALQQLLLPIRPLSEVIRGPGSIDSTLRDRPYSKPSE